MSSQNDTSTLLDQEHGSGPQEHASLLSGETTAVPSLTGSRDHLISDKQKDVETEQQQVEQAPALLNVPIHQTRRPSLQSTYSDLSELSYHPSRQNAPLVRTESYDSDYGQSQSLFVRKLRSIWITNYGALLVLAAQFFGCLMNLFTRLLETPGEHGDGMHPFQILFARQGITAAVCIAYGVYTKAIPHFPLGPKGVRWLLVLRAVGGFFGVFGMVST